MATTINANDYYKQIQKIGHDESNAFGTSAPFVVTNTGTFQLIDEMIRDLVSIKNVVKDTRDKLIGATISATGAEDTITLNDATGINPKKSTVHALTSGDRDAKANNSDPSVYENERETGKAYLSEAALFFALKTAGDNIKTIIYGTKSDIKDLDATEIKDVA